MYSTVITGNHAYRVILRYQFFFVVYKIRSDSLPCCLTHYPYGKCFSLVQKKKNCVGKGTIPHSLARSLKAAFLWNKFASWGKSSVIWDVQSYGASSQEGLSWTNFSLPHQKILRPINLVFDDNWPEWPWIVFFFFFFFFFWKFSTATAYQTLKYKTYDIIKLKVFPNLLEVIL